MNNTKVVFFDVLW